MIPSDQENEELVEVCLAGQDLSELCLIEYGSFIRRIELSFNVLISLRGLHICSETLEELILDNNLLERVDFRAEFPNLHTLSLNKNRISDLDILLQELSSRVRNIRHLSLLGNPVCPDQLTNDLADEKDYEVYRCHILYHLKNIRFLDHRAVLPTELRESRKLTYAQVNIFPSFTSLIGTAGNIVEPVTQQPRPSTSRQSSTRVRTSSSSSESNGHANANAAMGLVTSGLPRTSTDEKSRGRTGKRRFRYVGKNSEGNRFIRDNDL